MTNAAHGGRRAGAGRKPLPDYERLVKQTVWLSPRHIDLITDWRGLTTFSESLRMILDLVIAEEEAR